MTYNELKQVLSADLKGVFRIVIDFSIIDDPLFSHCTIGKSPHTDGDIYWCQINNEELSAYNFRSFEGLAQLPIVNYHTLEELWDRIEIHSIDGFPPRQRLSVYLNDEN